MKDGSPHHMSSECGMKQALTVFSELDRFLSNSSNSRERKNRQKLLRNLKVFLHDSIILAILYAVTTNQVLELIMCVLELHQDIKKGMSDPEVCRICFRVITKYLEGKSNKNKTYITELVKLGFLFSASVRCC